MKKFNLLTILLISLLFVSCEKDDIKGRKAPIKPQTGTVNIVSQFVYDGMSSYYLWSKEVEPKAPTVKDTDPEKYFYSILNGADTKHGWSWITGDVESLLSGFQGEETKAFGFNALPLWANDARTQIIVFVRYVFPNTPAEAAGLKRGDVITHANGAQLNENNYSIVNGSNAAVTFTVLDQNFENPRQVQITPGSFSTNPVLYSNVYEIEGKKIGYLFYTSFIANYNSSLYNAFLNFKQSGVDELVLDLRYNRGGSVLAAIYLASLIAPEANVRRKDIFTTMSYNDYINAAYDKNKWDRNDYLGDYDNKKDQNPLNANLSLNKVYIIATGDSYSASELVTFCLKPYMTVNHIGEKTGGKYTASWTIHPYNSFNGTAQPVYVESKLTAAEKNSLRNWAMQPIVGRYTDKDGKDFINDDGVVPNHPIKSQEYNTETWKPIGNVEDYLFAKAISLITGKPYNIAVTRSNLKEYADPKLFSPRDQILKEAVIIDKPPMIMPE